MPSFDTAPDDPLYRATALFASTGPPDYTPAEPDTNGLLPLRHDPAAEKYMNEAFTAIDDGTHIETTNRLFRNYHFNVAVLGSIVMPSIVEAHEEKRPVQIYEPGCSSGKDTVSLAAVLALHDVNFHIDAADLNPGALALAQQPYQATMHQLEKNIRYWQMPPNILTYFERVDDGRIQLAQELRDRITFHQLDIRDQTPAHGRYDAVMLNNVLCHYTKPSRMPMAKQIVSTVASSLRPGGIFTYSDRFVHDEIFNNEFFATHGLVPAADLYDTNKWKDHASNLFGHTVTPLPWQGEVWDTLFAKQPGIKPAQP